MQFESLGMPGVILLRPSVQSDKRGKFVKYFEWDYFKGGGLWFHLEEEFTTISHRGVLRGMHFQTPPFGHNKFVTCLNGKILDVLVDLRAGPGYGSVVSHELDGSSFDTMFVPEGVAHGFLSLTDNAYVSYRTDKKYAPDYDSGIKWDSFGFVWPNIGTPLTISDRDSGFVSLDEFSSPW